MEMYIVYTSHLDLCSAVDCCVYWHVQKCAEIMQVEVHCCNIGLLYQYIFEHCIITECLFWGILKSVERTLVIIFPKCFMKLFARTY
jgi:hypothetical protein